MTVFMGNPCIIRKNTGKYLDRGVGTPSLSHPDKISYGQGSTAEFLKFSEIKKAIPYPNRDPISGGRSPGNVTKFWNNLIYK